MFSDKVYSRVKAEKVIVQRFFQLKTGSPFKYGTNNNLLKKEPRSSKPSVSKSYLQNEKILCIIEKTITE